jgi:DNA-binding MarR family transcriptional regulator
VTRGTSSNNPAGTEAPPNPPDTAGTTTAEVVGLAVTLVRQAAALGTRLAEESGLHTTDVRALQVLDLAAADEELSMGALARELSISPQAASALLSRLEARDLAHRQPFPGDRRRTRVVLGAAARTFGQEHLLPLAARLQAVADSLTPQERTAVAHFLAAVVR